MRDIYEIGPIAALGALQILEPKLDFVGTTRGKVALDPSEAAVLLCV